MIDINKYEGHTPGPWWCNEDDWRCIDTMIKHEKGEDLKEICRVFYREVDYNGKPLPNGPVGFNKATAQLIADAPKLLAEVKRLNRFVHCAMNFMSKHDLDFQFLNQHGVFTAPGGGSISTFTPYSYKWDDETKVSSEPIEFTVRGEEE